MALYRYVKAPVVISQVEARSYQSRTFHFPFQFLPIVFIFIGFTLLSSVFFPLLSYQFLESNRFQSKLLTPLAESKDLESPRVLSDTQDLTVISNWFPEVAQEVKIPGKVTHYTLSVPRLKIFGATVTIGGEDLQKSLIHYGGTALPGEFGNTVIFGHSVLPQFFNPKNYMTIFSTLPELEKGDQVLVNYDGVEYKYQVYKMAEVEANDIVILEQQYDGSYLTLVTCVPPGTYWKRLAVRARLIKT